MTSGLLRTHQQGEDEHRHREHEGEEQSALQGAAQGSGGHAHHGGPAGAAQVAAQGHAHYLVSKSEVDGATESTTTTLDAKQRQEELARMLGGVEVSREARAAAKRLLTDVD